GQLEPDDGADPQPGGFGQAGRGRGVQRRAAADRHGGQRHHHAGGRTQGRGRFHGEVRMTWDAGPGRPAAVGRVGRYRGGADREERSMDVDLRLAKLRKECPRHDGGAPVVAVDDVELQIEKGAMVTLLGPSGCGKTTLLRMIAGFEEPTSGEVWFGDRRVDRLAPNARDTAMVFQSYAIFPHLNVYENVAFGLRMQRVDKATLERRVAEVLDLVGLTAMAGRAPSQLSGGQQQRVALARCIVLEPHVLLFDEPLSNLDAKLREQMRVEIRELQQRLGITSVYVTHDQVEAM